MDDKIKVRKRRLTDYVKDPANANRGNERGRKMIADSFQENRAGRSLLADNGDVLIAGNQSIDGALAAGIEEVIEIETSGDAVIVHKRVDLEPDSPERMRLALSDNRTQQVNLDFDPERLLGNPKLLEGLWRDDEIDELLAARDVAQMVTDQTAAGLSTERALGDPKKQIKPVLYVDEVAVFEKAIRATGMTNRGQAVLEICRVYLEVKSHG